MTDRLRERIAARITRPQTPDAFADVVVTEVAAALAERRACFNPDHAQPAPALDVEALARALCRRDEYVWDDEDPAEREKWLPEARAIAAAYAEEVRR